MFDKRLNANAKNEMKKLIHVDCTLRDGGYYNNWDFSHDLITAYLSAMAAISIDVVELGFRSFDTEGYRGGCAYTTDRFLSTLVFPKGLSVAVMVNAAELVNHELGPELAAQRLFAPRTESPVELVRIACHANEIVDVLPACDWLVEAGYRVGLNLMQIADRSDLQIEQIAAEVSGHGIEVLYFADSLGSLDSANTVRIVQAIRRSWLGEIGIHTHDNMGRAISNTLQAIEEGVAWVDSTVTGMGRGPGNAQTEYLVIELERLTGRSVKLASLLALISQHFGPMKVRYGWGQNPYYYLAGQYGIHPTFLQEMLSDNRYGDEDIFSVIDYLRKVGGKKYKESLLEEGRNKYAAPASGKWQPKEAIENREVLLLGAGPSATLHQKALEEYIKNRHPYVVALNTTTNITASLINLRVASHPVRLLVDCESYNSLSHPLAVPFNCLDDSIREALASVKIYDYGLTIEPNSFVFGETSSIVPSSLVLAYALAICTSGCASRILLAGFDGYNNGDLRRIEVQELLSLYQITKGARPLLAVTPTKYLVNATSIYAL